MTHIDHNSPLDHHHSPEAHSVVSIPYLKYMLTQDVQLMGPLMGPNHVMGHDKHDGTLG